MKQRLTQLLKTTGLTTAQADELAQSTLSPPPGSFDVSELEGADDPRLVLLAAIRAVVRLRDQQQIPRRLLAWLGEREEQLAPYDRGRYWHLRGYLAWRGDGEVHRAYTALNRGIRLLEGEGSAQAKGYLARVLDTFGQLLHHQGIISAAQRDFRKSLELREASGDEAGAGITLGNLARLSMEIGDFRSAADYLRRDLAIVERLTPQLTGLRSQLSSHLGVCLLEAGDPQAARRAFESAASLASKDPGAPGEAFARIGLARAAMAADDAGLDGAATHLGWLEEYLASAQTPPGLLAELEANVRLLAGDIHWASGETGAAAEAYRGALAWFDRSHTASPLEYAQLLNKLAQVELHAGRRLEGAQLLRQALQRLDATAMDALRTEVEGQLKEVSKELWLLHCSGRFLGQGQLELLLELAGQQGFRGDLENMVILFSDIRRFTAISEHLTPSSLIEVLNDYLSHMTRCIERFGGIVDKFIGDAVMALFLEKENAEPAAVRAARAALMMQDELEHFNRSLPEGLPRFQVGIGLHSGQVVAGIIGSPQKRSYTAIGDPVNTASRLEGMTKILGGGILISRQLADQIPGQSFIKRPVGRFRPKGRDEAVDVFELMLERDGSLAEGELESEAQGCARVTELVAARGLAEVRGQLAALASGCQDAARAAGYRFLSREVEALEAAGLPDDWSGEIILKDK